MATRKGFGDGLARGPSETAELRLIVKKIVANQQGIAMPEGQQAEFRKRLLMNSVISACDVATFYSENKNDMLIERDEVTIMNRMAHRDVFACEAVDANSGAPIRDKQSTNFAAVAMRYELTVPIRNPMTGDLSAKEYCEFGSMNSRQEGFNHQKTCMAARFIDNILLGDRSIPFTATYANNGHSSSNLVTGMGFQEVDVVAPEISVVRHRQLELQNKSARGARWFRPTIRSVHMLSDWILDLQANPVRIRANKKFETFESYPTIQIEFGVGFSEPFFTLAKMLSVIRPQTVQELGDLVHGNPNYYPSDFLHG